MIKQAATLLAIIALTGCETNPYDDSDVDIKPPNSGEVLSVEHEEGNLICVTERSDPTVRHCVPRVHEED